MKIPSSLKVGAHTIKVRTVTLDKCGEFNREKQTIFLADWLPETQREATFIHELLHALNNELDHALLDSLAEQLYQVMRDNRLLR